MFIKKISLKNIYRHGISEIFMNPKVTILTDASELGQKAVLNSITTSLHYYVSYIQKNNNELLPTKSDYIKPDVFKSFSKLEINDVIHGHINWILCTFEDNDKIHYMEFTKLKKLANYYRKKFKNDEKINLPLIAYYPCDSIDFSISSDKITSKDFEQIHIFSDFIPRSINFDAFFKRLIHISGHYFTFVQKAITEIIPNIELKRIEYSPNPNIIVNKNYELLNFNQLSETERIQIVLIGDIASKLIIMNPLLDNPLEGNGIIIIDKIDSNLNPIRQRGLLQKLTSTFPNCQFIITTNSPIIISDYKDSSVYSFDGTEIMKTSNFYGEDVNTVLTQCMNTDIRNKNVQLKLNKLLEYINDNQLENSKKLLNELKNELSHNNVELIKSELLISKKEISNKLKG